MAEIELYPSITLVFVVFNLLGWWYRGKVFFSWWWMVPIYVVQIIVLALMNKLMKAMLEQNKKENLYK